MTQFRQALGVLLALCLTVRVCSWLVAPALPLIIVLFVLVSLFVIILRPGRGL